MSSRTAQIRIRSIPVQYVLKGMVIVVDKDRYFVVQSSITKNNKIRIKASLVGKPQILVEYDKVWGKDCLVRVESIGSGCPWRNIGKGEIR